MSGSAPVSANSSSPLNTNTADCAAATATQANAPFVELDARAPLAGLAMLRDSVRVLGAFAWGKPARLSHNKSAELCSLMNGWN